MPARRGRRGHASTLAVIVVLLLSGCGAFRGSDTTPEPSASSAASGPAGTATPAVTGSRSTRLPARTVPAFGQQLFSPAPLSGTHQDQGSSVPLPDGRTLWIFADTFQQHTHPSFFNTSAAAVTDPGDWQLQYSMTQPTGSGARVPSVFLPLTPDEAADRLTRVHYQAVWPTGSTVLPDGRILISYAKYRVLLQGENQFVLLGAGLFTFRYRGYDRFTAGDQAQRIADDIWSPADGAVRSPVYADGYVYFTQCSDLRCWSLRTTPEGLASTASYRWWTGSGWSSSRSERQQVRIASNHPGGNPSIVRLQNGVWAMADTEAGVVSGIGYLWVAPHPWGPWSTAAPFLMPGCPAQGCYGLNLHPETSTASSLRVSYCTGEHDPVVRVTDVPVDLDPGGTSISTG